MVKGITRVIREADKSNLANFDVAMLCAVQNKEITLNSHCLRDLNYAPTIGHPLGEGETQGKGGDFVQGPTHS